MIRRMSRAVLLLTPLLELPLTSGGEVLPSDPQLEPMGIGAAPRATGDVQIQWMGGGGGASGGQTGCDDMIDEGGCCRSDDGGTAFPFASAGTNVPPPSI